MAEQPAPPDPILHDPHNDLRKRATRRLIAAVVLIAAAVAALTFVSNYPAEKLAGPAPAEQVAAVPEKPVPTEPPPAEPPPEAPVEPPPPPADEAPPAPEPPPPPEVASQPGKAPVQPAKPAAAPARTPALSAAVPREQPAAPAAKPAPAEKAAAPQARQPAPPPRQEPAPKGYVVQLGVFGNLDNARQLQERLAQNGIKSYTETRVNVGPFHSKAEADQALAKLRSMGISAVVAPTR